MTARQDEIEVHEMSLDGAEFKEEEFLNQGSGSHFESRVSELVVLIPSAAGLPHLPQAVEQLVSKGFHNLVVALGGIDDLDTDGLEALSRSRQVVDTWAGSLRVSEANGSVAGALSSLQGEDAFETHDTRDSAIGAYRATMSEGPLDPGESQDLLTSSADEDLNNWGWGAEEAVASQPSVEIAQVHATEDELGKLDQELRRILMGGKRYVSLRLHFSRRLTTDDVDALTGARDYLKREGGQLALVSLPIDVLKSLRLLDLDREFLIVEGGAAAEEAHQRHANGQDPTAGVASAPAVAPVAATPVAPQPVVQPVPEPVLEPVLEPISSIELDSGISLTESDLSIAPIDNAELERVSAELGRLRVDHAAATAERSRLQEEVQGLRARLESIQAERDKAHATVTELQTSLRRSERIAAELEQSQSRAERRASQAEEEKAQVSADTRRLDGELTRLRQELDQARDATEAAKGDFEQFKASAIRPEQVTALEGKVREREEEIARLKRTLEETRAASGEDYASRCSELEEEKARILTEAEAEIQRLSNERQVLREELESAGEMIERLGKELELS